MPQPDDFGAKGRLRCKRCGSPIIAITARAIAGNRETCVSAGCDGPAAEPIDRPVFLRIVESYARRVA